MNDFISKTKLACRRPCFIQALRAMPTVVLATGQISPLDGQMLSPPSVVDAPCVTESEPG